MSIRCEGDSVLLEDVCPVEDAETLMHLLQANASAQVSAALGVAASPVDWSGCTHLHAACLQVLLVSGVPVHGVPLNAALARWVAPLFGRLGAGPDAGSGACGEA